MYHRVLGSLFPRRQAVSLCTQYVRLTSENRITQLKYRLRKWNFRQNFDAKTWDEIGRRTDKRKGEGKGSDIIHNLRRWKPSKIAKGTKRTRPSKVSTRHTGTLGWSRLLLTSSPRQARVSDQSPFSGSIHPESFLPIGDTSFCVHPTSTSHGFPLAVASISTLAAVLVEVPAPAHS